MQFTIFFVKNEPDSQAFFIRPSCEQISLSKRVIYNGKNLPTRIISFTKTLAMRLQKFLKTYF